jgi:hypothetical protein
MFVLEKFKRKISNTLSSSLCFTNVYLNFNCRLKVDRLESEKRELLNELTALRKKANTGAGGPSDVVSEFIRLINNKSR